MNTKAKLGCVVGVIVFLITTPIWYYLLFQILVAIKATELMWFLYWVYLPAGILLNILGEVVKNLPSDKTK